MRIKATQMERIFGMSQNGIRLYEKNGILRLERREGSSYRLYGPEEMLAMGSGVQLRLGTTSEVWLLTLRRPEKLELPDFS